MGNSILEDDILIREVGRAGHITLNRPRALNALTDEMVIAIEDALDRWRDQSDVVLVILDAVGPKAFCAGGDIAKLYQNGLDGDLDSGRAFWRQEYRLNLKIASYPKPIVVFMHGFVLGGGVGLAAHASHRIVGESAQIAMPECSIGMIPDVGGTHILGRSPGETGAYLGLTGARMGPADAIFATFADYFVPEHCWDGLKATLIKHTDPAMITDLAAKPPDSRLFTNLEEINEIFLGRSVPEILQTLSETGSAFADATLRQISKGAPLSLACALDAIRAARGASLKDALKREFRFAFRSLEQGDFLEGIRAQIVDRDFTPKWKHSCFVVPEKDIRDMLASLGPHEWRETRETP